MYTIAKALGWANRQQSEVSKYVYATNEEYKTERGGGQKEQKNTPATKRKITDTENCTQKAYDCSS